MGNNNSSARPSLDVSPLGHPNNSYWRNRRSEDTWKLREALLDGNATAACRLLGIDLTKYSVLEDHGGQQINGKQQDDEDGPQLVTGCMPFCRCFVMGPVSKKAAPDQTRKGECPQVRTQNAPSPGVRGGSAGSACMDAGCGSLDLGNHRWEDDGGHSALHYLARGRCDTEYEGVRTNFPVTGQHASPGPLAHESENLRCELLLVLMQEGRIGFSNTVLRTNQYGATALHVAAAVGNLQLIDVFLKSWTAPSRPTFAEMDVDTALLTPDGTNLVPVDVAAKFGHTGACAWVGSTP
jgi:hypothetical protein